MTALTPERREELRAMLAETRWRERIEWGGTVGVIDTDEIRALLAAADEADQLRARVERLEAWLIEALDGWDDAEQSLHYEYGTGDFEPDDRSIEIRAALAGEGRKSPLADPEIARDTILQHTDLSRTPDDD